MNVTRLLLLLILFSACSKDPADTTPIDNNGSDTIYGKLITVTNLMTDTSDSDPTSTNRPPVYYSLEENKQAPASYAKTSRWDVSFTSIYNSYLGGNNGTNNKNLGYGSSGKGGIYIVKQKFEDVTAIPSDDQFQTIDGAYGADDSGSFGTGVGWYFYDFGGSKYPNDPDKQHVVYPIEDRTVIVRTAKGNYAKIKMLSIYKDMLNPDDWKTYSPHPYYTFQYILVKAGSKSF
jgi:hypothetical protein